MFNSYKNTRQNAGEKVYKSIVLKNIVSLSLVLALILSALVFYPNTGQMTLAKKKERVNRVNPGHTSTEINGITSVEILDNGICWLKEESNGKYTWYGLDNSSGVFEKGSRFWVKQLSKDLNKTEWEKYYSKIDGEHKEAIESENLCIFSIGVTAPDGTEYRNFDIDIPLYIQLSEDWDREDINAIYISDRADETLENVSYVETDYPEGVATFAKLITRHFSPYAVYDKLTDKEKANLDIAEQNIDFKNNVQTNTETFNIKTRNTYIIFFIIISIFIIFATVIWFIKHKRNQNK